MGSLSDPEVSTVRFVPSASTSEIAPSSPAQKCVHETELNTIRRPSGDQSGASSGVLVDIGGQSVQPRSIGVDDPKAAVPLKTSSVPSGDQLGRTPATRNVVPLPSARAICMPSFS